MLNPVFMPGGTERASLTVSASAGEQGRRIPFQNWGWGPCSTSYGAIPLTVLSTLPEAAQVVLLPE